LHGAASAGADPAIKLKADSANTICFMVILLGTSEPGRCAAPPDRAMESA